jgi:tetratricopeptide (TPR) repeat protein
VEAANAYEFLAQAYLDKGDKKAARNVLQLYVDNGGRYPETIKKLAGLQEEAGDKQAAAATLDKINVIYPVNDEALHTRLGGLWFELGNYRGAIREYLAVIGHKPLDTAAAHFNAARAYHASGDGARAEDHLLEALESAPGFRPAQKLLLELKSTPERVPKRK